MGADLTGDTRLIRAACCCTPSAPCFHTAASQVCVFRAHWCTAPGMCVPTRSCGLSKLPVSPPFTCLHPTKLVIHTLVKPSLGLRPQAPTPNVKGKRTSLGSAFTTHGPSLLQTEACLPALPATQCALFPGCAQGRCYPGVSASGWQGPLHAWPHTPVRHSARAPECITLACGELVPPFFLHFLALWLSIHCVACAVWGGQERTGKE